MVRGFLLGAATVAIIWVAVQMWHELTKPKRPPLQRVGLAVGDPYWKPCPYIEAQAAEGDYIVAKEVSASGEAPSGFVPDADVSAGVDLVGNLTGFGPRAVHDAGDNKEVTLDVVGHFAEYEGALHKIEALDCFR